MPSDDIHKINELKQVNLILKKLAKISEYKNVDHQSEQKSNDVSHRMAELEQVNLISKKLGVLLQNKKGGKISAELLTKLHHELRTPMVPIRAYTDMLLAGNFGKLTERQIKKIEVVNSNVKRLQETVMDLLDPKKFGSDNNFVNNMTENNSSPHESLTKTEEIPKENGKPKEQLSKTTHQVKELEQEKFLLKKSLNLESQKNQILTKKHYLTIAISVAVIGVIMTAFSFFMVELAGYEYQVKDLGTIKSNYLIQNLRGDTIDTWVSWRIYEDQLFHVHIVNSPLVTEERSQAIFEVIMSREEIDIDDSLLHKGPKGSVSTYYLGWYGALNSIEQSTKFPIPKNLHFHITDIGDGDVLIKLESHKDPNGYSGFTESIIDDTQNQILKSKITIYEVDGLSEQQIKTVLRHELGHGFGLAHSTAPEDLMYPEIRTAYPYISDCDLDAIAFLYDDGGSSQVVCEK